jgi:hypothetical protein
LALGFLATKARSDVLTLSPPADLVPGLVDALEHLGSALADELKASGQITARRDLLGELLRVAIDAAGDEVALQSTHLLRSDGSAAQLRAGVARLTGLLELLDAVDA